MVLLEEFIQLVAVAELRLLVIHQMVDQIVIHQEDLAEQELQQVFQDHQLLTLVVVEVLFILHLHNQLEDLVAEVVEVMLLHLIKDQDKLEQPTLEEVVAVVCTDWQAVLEVAES